MTEFTRANVGNAGYGNNELILLYEVQSQSTSSNTSNVKTQALLRCPVYLNTSATYLSVQGGSRFTVGSSWSAGDHVLWEGTYTVSHNSDGTGSFGFTATISSTYLLSGTASGTITLPTIPRYASITSFSVSKRDETSVKFNWSANATCDYAWYSKNGGSSWSALPSNNIVSGLSANTSYNFKLRVRRQDSQLTTDSGTYTQSTYNYPYCSDSPNFIIGNELTLKFYNPLSRSITVTGIGADGSTIFSGTTSSTSITGFNDSSSVNAQYNSIPNSSSGEYKVQVVYGSSTKTRQNNNTYTVNANECRPIFEDFNYSTNLSELTGDNATIVNGKTTTTFTINTQNKAIAQNGASIQRYSFECDNQSNLANYSTNSDVVSAIQNCTSDIIKVTAIDSRGLETTVTKIVPSFKAYFSPTFVSYQAEREDGIETIVYLDMKLNFWNYSFGDKINSIRSLKYRIKETGSDNWSNWFSLNVGHLNIRNEQATLEDELIYLDGISQGFTSGTAYDLQLQVSDGASNYILDTTESGIFYLTDGQVAFSILKDSNGNYHLGINGMPDLDYTLKVHGTISND